MNHPYPCYPICMPAYEGEYRIDPETGKVWREVGYTNIHGYRVLSIGGKTKLIHRMVWESVNGPIPKGLVINHLNGDKEDNRIENLEVCTHARNHEHARNVLGHDYGAGERRRGEDSHHAKLTERQVREIRASYQGRYGEMATLAQKYGVEISSISKILKRKTWNHVD